MEYGYSYILGWLGAAMILVAGIMFICVAWSVRNKKWEKVQWVWVLVCRCDCGCGVFLGGCCGVV